MNYENNDRIVGSVEAKRSGIGVEALIKENDRISVNRGSNGDVYLRIGFNVNIRLDPAKAAEIKAAL